MDWLDRDQTNVAMTTRQIDDLVKAERKQKELPEMPEDMDFEDDMEFEDEPCNCPSCRARRQLGLPPGMEEMMEAMGPEVVMRALDQIIGNMGPKRRKGRSRRVLSDDDVPF